MRRMEPGSGSPGIDSRSRNASASGSDSFRFQLEAGQREPSGPSKVLMSPPDSLRCSATSDRHWVLSGTRVASMLANNIKPAATTATSRTFRRHINLCGETASDPCAADAHKSVLGRRRFNQDSEVDHRQLRISHNAARYDRRNRRRSRE
jgi:hypothetical protein